MKYVTKRVETVAGVAQYRVVVEGAAPGGCDYPAGAGVAGAIGVTQEPQPDAGHGVSVKVSGRTFAIASAAIARGDYVHIGDNAGRVASCNADVIAAPGAALVIHVIGKALTAALAPNDRIEIELGQFVVNRAAS